MVVGRTGPSSNLRCGQLGRCLSQRFLYSSVSSHRLLESFGCRFSMVQPCMKKSTSFQPGSESLNVQVLRTWHKSKVHLFHDPGSEFSNWNRKSYKGSSHQQQRQKAERRHSELFQFHCRQTSTSRRYAMELAVRTSSARVPRTVPRGTWTLPRASPRSTAARCDLRMRHIFGTVFGMTSCCSQVESMYNINAIVIANRRRLVIVDIYDIV